jgi:hypothetical protein
MVIATTLFNLAKKANVILHEGTVCDVLFIGKKQLLLTHGSEETNDEWGKNFPLTSLSSWTSPQATSKEKTTAVPRSCSKPACTVTSRKRTFND